MSISRLIPTGQVISYDTDDDGAVKAGISATPRFVDNGDGTITDHVTKLMWPSDVSSTSAAIDIGSNWSNSIAFCNSLNYGGYTDWRMPNVQELLSIFDFSNSNNAKLYSDFSGGDDHWNIWTSTTNPQVTTHAYYIFVGLTLVSGTKTPGFLPDFGVIPVRDGIDSNAAANLEVALLNHYNADANLVSILVNGLYDTNAPQGTQHPYGVFQMISDKPKYNFSDDFEDMLIQFKLFSKVSGSAVELGNMYDALIASFDFAVLTLDDYCTVSMTRENAIKTKIEDVWEYTVLYRLYLQRDVSVR